MLIRHNTLTTRNNLINALAKDQIKVHRCNQRVATNSVAVKTLDNPICNNDFINMS